MEIIEARVARGHGISGLLPHSLGSSIACSTRTVPPPAQSANPNESILGIEFGPNLSRMVIRRTATTSASERALEYHDLCFPPFARGNNSASKRLPSGGRCTDFAACSRRTYFLHSRTDKYYSKASRIALTRRLERDTSLRAEVRQGVNSSVVRWCARHSVLTTHRSSIKRSCQIALITTFECASAPQCD